MNITGSNFDIVIVGGGLAGLTTAYFLSREGLRVAVFEANEAGSGATSKTTAMITQMIDTYPAELIDLVGLRNARLVWRSGAAAIDTIERILREEKIDCSFMRVPAFTYARSRRELTQLDEEFLAMQRLGSKPIFHAAERLPFKNAGALELPDQAKFNVIPYIAGLKRAAEKNGTKIFEHSRVRGIKKISERGRWFQVSTEDGLVEAPRILIATYYPYKNPKETHFKKGMYVSYCLQAEVPPGTAPQAVYWDTANPYHYFRIDPGGKKNGVPYDLITLGGEDHRAELKLDEERHFGALEGELKKLFGPMNYKVTQRWIGPILEPTDGLPLIGTYEPNAYVAAAFSGNGMTYSTITGILVSDLVAGRKNPWKKLYDPRRPMKGEGLIKKGIDYVEEFIGGVIG